VTPELEQVTFRRTSAGPQSGGRAGGEVWELVATSGEVIAWAEVFAAPTQWGVRVRDRVPTVADTDHVRLVGNMQIRALHCPADTVDVRQGRSHEHHALVKVGGEYV
jgi:hypothetical protein